MKIRTLVLTTAILATASCYAMAQSAPTERTGSKTDVHQSQQQMQKDKAMKPTTTGSGMSSGGSSMSGSGTSGSNSNMGATSDKANGQMLNKNVSPASPDAGEKQQK